MENLSHIKVWKLVIAIHDGKKMGIIIIQTQAPHYEALDTHALISSSSCPFHREGNWIQEVKAFLKVT